MTSPADRRAALLSLFADLLAAYREMAGLPLPDESSDEGIDVWASRCDQIMARADRASEALAIERCEYARAVGATKFTYEGIAPLDRDLAERVAALTAEATECLKRQEARMAAMGEQVTRVRERLLGRIGRITNGRKVHQAYRPTESGDPLFFDRKE